MVDLHTHTIYSDGTWNVKKLLEEAKKNGVTLLSITDHDLVDAYLELRKNDYSKFFSGKIIPGCEFDCVFDNIKIELLGYNFDIDKMNLWLQEKYSKNKNEDLLKEFQILINACKKNNIIIDEIEYDVKMGWPVDCIYKLIRKYPENKNKFLDKEWNDISYFFRCCTCNVDFPLFIDFSFIYPNAKEVSECIRKLGGKVFIAHLYKYPLSNYKKYLDELVKSNIIDGIEVYYSKFSDEQINFLENYCKDNKLLMSGGTDCHCEKDSYRKIGIGYGNMNIKEDIVNWL